jgi:predicted transcriptional regulator
MGELEQAVLETLWDLDRPASGRQVHERLSGRDLAYTTVMTVLDRLVGKGVLTKERDGRAFRYAPRMSRAEMTAELMREALDGTGADRDQALVSFVGEATPEDIAALRRALADLA